ncbi:DUF6673 family protein [Candidatus Pseudoruminococcus sp.]|uniref:DUF6673 family protein n=1 Tax=Candidatus Pseudoruminococcus sp. TaxID=3101048 RepID=UPI00399BD8BB
MLIMGHEVQDLDFLDADVLEKVETASKKVFDECKNAAKKAKTESEAVRNQCNAIAEFINELFGEGAAEKLIKNGSNLFTCINVFGEVIKAIEQSKIEQNQEFEKLFSKYSIERIKRE